MEVLSNHDKKVEKEFLIEDIESYIDLSLLYGTIPYNLKPKLFKDFIEENLVNVIKDNADAYGASQEIVKRLEDKITKLDLPSKKDNPSIEDKQNYINEFISKMFNKTINYKDGNKVVNKSIKDFFNGIDISLMDDDYNVIYGPKKYNLLELYKKFNEFDYKRPSNIDYEEVVESSIQDIDLMDKHNTLDTKNMPTGISLRDFISKEIPSKMNNDFTVDNMEVNEYITKVVDGTLINEQNEVNKYNKSNDRPDLISELEVKGFTVTGEIPTVLNENDYAKLDDIFLNEYDEAKVKDRIIDITNAIYSSLSSESLHELNDDINVIDEICKNNDNKEIKDLLDKMYKTYNEVEINLTRKEQNKEEYSFVTKTQLDVLNKELSEEDKEFSRTILREDKSSTQLINDTLHLVSNAGVITPDLKRFDAPRNNIIENHSISNVDHLNDSYKHELDTKLKDVEEAKKNYDNSDNKSMDTMETKLFAAQRDYERKLDELRIKGCSNEIIEKYQNRLQEIINGNELKRVA